MRALNKQKGLSLTGYMFIFLVMALIATIALRLTPLFMQNMGMQRAINQILEQPDFGMLTKPAFYKRMDQLFYTNDVDGYNVERISKILKVGKDKKTGQKQIELKYEVDAPFFKNVFFLVRFDQIFPVHKEGVDSAG